MVLKHAPAKAAHAAMVLIGLLLAFDSRHSSRLNLWPLGWRALRAANQDRIRRRCAVVRVSDEVALCRVLGRYKMYVDPSDRGLAVHLMFDGYWEMWVTQVVAALVRPGMVAVDVGANQGYYTLLLAGLIGPGGRVHAVEPNPRMLSLLCWSVFANGMTDRVQVHARPLGASSADRVVLRVPEGSPSGAQVVAAADDDADAMQTATLDDILGEQPVDFIKIDAEGSGFAVWQGMRRILARSAPLTVVMEFFADLVPDTAAFLDEALGYGFSVSHIHQSRGLQPVTAGQIMAAPRSQEWMLVLQRGRTNGHRITAIKT